MSNFLAEEGYKLSDLAVPSKKLLSAVFVEQIHTCSTEPALHVGSYGNSVNLPLPALERERIAKWVELLRTPGLKQTRWNLTDIGPHLGKTLNSALREATVENTKNCCLGVACFAAKGDLRLKLMTFDSKPSFVHLDRHFVEVSRSAAILPSSVAQYYGFGFNAAPPVFVTKDLKYFANLTTLNDSVRLSFRQIATLVEFTYLKDHSEAWAA